MDIYEKIDSVLNHIKNVQRNCYKLGLKLIRIGETEFGRNLIANGQIHDNSKFKGIEFEELFSECDLLETAVKHHNTTNYHHPECWGSIQKMPDIYLAEFVCDTSARSSEFGSDIKQWMREKATIKYGFEMTDEVGRKITYYLDLLLEKPFVEKRHVSVLA